MSSILTNMSAMTAVQNLAATQKSLSEVQNEISTGLAVSSAEDNAAYYSIAQTMRTSVSSLSAVSSSLNLGSSVVSTATAATTNVTSILQSIQKDLVSASQPGTDLGALQTDISTLRSQLGSSISTASFNGVNLLDGSNATSVQFVAGVTGSGANTAVNTLTVNTSTTNLGGATYVAGSNSLVDTAASTFAALTSATAANNTAQSSLTSATSANTAAASALTNAVTGATSAQLLNTSSSQFIALFGNGATLTSGTVANIQAGSLAAALVGTDGSVVINTSATQGALTSYSSGATGTGTLGTLRGASESSTTSTNTATSAAGVASADATALSAANTAYVNATTAANGNAAASKIVNGGLFAISQISLTNASTAQIATYVTQVGTAISAVNTASETLGAAAKNIDLQSSYTSSLSDSFTSGIGSLVDADMNEASTRLSALQTQQQLGVQALSVANQNSQLILKLFGG